MKTKENKTGLVYGNWSVLGVSPSPKRERLICRCVCGVVKSVDATSLKFGQSMSCGCLKKECKPRLRHGHCKRFSSSPEYGVWVGMIQRCTNTNNNSYTRYGGRGITVCSSWLDFDCFIADMGLKPDPSYQLDRTDNEKGYSPDNCAWVTCKVNSNNRRSNINIEINSVNQNIGVWLKQLDIRPSTYYRRIKRGLTPEQALGLTPKPIDPIATN